MERRLYGGVYDGLPLSKYFSRHNNGRWEWVFRLTAYFSTAKLVPEAQAYRISKITVRFRIFSPDTGKNGADI